MALVPDPSLSRYWCISYTILFCGSVKLARLVFVVFHVQAVYSLIDVMARCDTSLPPV